MGIRTRRFANERLFVLVGLGAASALCLALEALRELHYGALDFRFLVWNLMLAWMPLVFALVVYDAYRRGARIVTLSPVALLWLLFLPNAPYIVTDFVHLSAARPAPLWFDGIELSAFAWTGLLLGFVSLYLVHAVARHRFGALAGWAAVPAVLALVSAGVYLGRVKRWNSWDLLTQPGSRLTELRAQLHIHLADPTSLGRVVGATLAMTLLLGLAYVVFYLLMGTRLEPDSARRARE